MTDQWGVKHTFAYNDRRQLEADQITDFGSSSADQLIESITRQYDSLGRLTHITSHGNPTGDPLNTTDIENQVKYTYDDRGKMSKSEQEHGGAVDPNTPVVDYIYDLTSDPNGVYDDGLRLKNVTYPLVPASATKAAQLDFWYDVSNSVNERLNRVRYHKLWSGTFLSDNEHFTSFYRYNGTGRVAAVEIYKTNLRTEREMFGATATNYDAWDRFGRTLQQKWKKNTTVHDQVDYTYDFAGNRLTRDVEDTSVFDQEYYYDGLHRLRAQKTGQLSSGVIINPTGAENFTLDQLGNWTIYGKDGDGDLIYTGANDRLQTRSHNDVNELSTIDEYNNTDWVTVVHDAAGNMTTIPQPLAPSSSYSLKYDAWNRLVEVKDGTTVVQANEYDGLNRRIIRDESGGSGVLKHFYYSNQWQVLVEANSSNVATAMYSYHPQYVDSVAVRIRDADAHIYLQDANYNVTAVMDSAGSVVERYSYTPYGEVTVLDPNFSPVTGNTSTISNEYLYTGRRLDPETGLQLNRNRFMRRIWEGG